MKILTDDILQALIEIAGFVEITPAREVQRIRALLGEHARTITSSVEVNTLFPAKLKHLHHFLYIQKTLVSEGDYHYEPGCSDKYKFDLSLKLAKFQKQALSIPILKKPIVLPSYVNLSKKLATLSMEASFCSYEDAVFFCQQRLVAIICCANAKKDTTTRAQFTVLSACYRALKANPAATIGEQYFCGLFELYALDEYRVAETTFKTLETHSGAAFELAMLYFNSCYDHKKGKVSALLHMPRMAAFDKLMLANLHCSQAIFNAIPNPNALALKAMIYSLQPAMAELPLYTDYLRKLNETNPTVWWELALATGSLFAYVAYPPYWETERFLHFIPAKNLTGAYGSYEKALSGGLSIAVQGYINIAEGICEGLQTQPHFMWGCLQNALP